MGQIKLLCASILFCFTPGNFHLRFYSCDDRTRRSTIMKFDVLRKFVIALVAQTISCAVNKSENALASKEQSEGRFVPPPPPLFPSLLFPVNAATGILVAIAVPIPLPQQNVFVSYNFEGNYNMANIPADSFPGPLNRVRLKLLPKFELERLKFSAKIKKPLPVC